MPWPLYVLWARESTSTSMAFVYCLAAYVVHDLFRVEHHRLTANQQQWQWYHRDGPMRNSRTDDKVPKKLYQIDDPSAPSRICTI